jgi:hypothetical protein
VHQRRPRSIIVAIPARGEAEDIVPCLYALAAQTGARADATLVCLNNCADGSARLIRQIAGSLPFAVEVLEVTLPGESACVGAARRIAMDRAAAIAGEDGILLTTDAGGRAAPEWLVANVAAIYRGAEAVAGRAVIDPADARLIPAHLHAIDTRACAYAALLDEIAALLDPDPTDPWPRHDEHSGASIAVTVPAYRRAGGMPMLSFGEDRAFFDALRRVDTPIRHAPGARVVVSARIIGRAPDGTAETIRRRIEKIDDMLGERLESVAASVCRVKLRAALRAAWQSRTVPPALAERLDLPGALLAGLMTSCHFGAAWAEVEVRSPVLRRVRVPLAQLAAQTDHARYLRDTLAAKARQAEAALRGTADPADTTFPAAAE